MFVRLDKVSCGYYAVFNGQSICGNLCLLSFVSSCGSGEGGCTVEMAHLPVEKQLMDSTNCTFILQLPDSEYSVT